MNSTKIRLMLMAVILFFSVQKIAAKECSIEDERQAEYVANRLNSWSAVQRNYLKFVHCDDGSIGEGFSESITVLLAKKWGETNRLAQLAAKDKKFEEFVLKHIDTSVPEARLKIIANNASKRCGKLPHELCKKIVKRARHR